MPTWVGLIGLAGVAATATAQIGNFVFIPPHYRALAVTLSGGLLGVERFMQGFDYRTVVSALASHPDPTTLANYLNATNPQPIATSAVTVRQVVSPDDHLIGNPTVPIATAVVGAFPVDPVSTMPGGPTGAPSGPGAV
jgi:hypothetical protein